MLLCIVCSCEFGPYSYNDHIMFTWLLYLNMLVSFVFSHLAGWGVQGEGGKPGKGDRVNPILGALTRLDPKRVDGLQN